MEQQCGWEEEGRSDLPLGGVSHLSHPCHLSQTMELPQSRTSACSRDQKGDREDMGSLTGSIEAYIHTAYEVKS